MIEPVVLCDSVNGLFVLMATECFLWVGAKFLGAFAKLRRAAVSFVVSVCPHVKTRLTLDEFSLNVILNIFSKPCREDSTFIKIGQE